MTAPQRGPKGRALRVKPIARLCKAPTLLTAKSPPAHDCKEQGAAAVAVASEGPLASAGPGAGGSAAEQSAGLNPNCTAFDR